MGKIEDMQNEQNDINISYMRKQQNKRNLLPRLKINGFKDLAKLVGPTSGKYHLSKNQRNFQIGARTTIFALIASGVLAVGGGMAMNQYVSQNEAIESISENELDKNDVLKHAEDKLILILYQDRLSAKENVTVNYSHNDEFDKDVLTIFEESPMLARSSEKYSYTRYNLLTDQYLNKRQNNDPMISELINLMLDIQNNENPTQKDLEKLDTLSSKLRVLDFHLVDKSIVDKSLENEQKNSSYER